MGDDNAKTDRVLEHMKAGMREDEPCLVCHRPLYGVTTDLFGEMVCHTCGTSYQFRRPSMKEFLERHGLRESDIADRYCNCYEFVPLLRDYWSKTGRRVPFGTWLEKPEYTQEEYEAFYLWVADHADEYRERFPGLFLWDSLQDAAVRLRGQFQGANI